MLSPLSSAHALSGMMTITLCSVAVLSILTQPGVQLPVGLGVGTLADPGRLSRGSRLVDDDQLMAALLDTPGPDLAVLMPAPPTMVISQ